MTSTDWREHTHYPSDPFNKQHGPDLHTHGTDGKLDTLLGEPYPPTPKPPEGVDCPHCGTTLYVECED